jgi:hypothetical protein
MYDDKTVGEALKLFVGLDPSRVEECRSDIEDAFIEIGRDQLEYDRVQTKQSKRDTQKLAAALRKVNILTRSQSLDPSIREDFPRDVLDRWIAECDEIGAAPADRKARWQPWKTDAAWCALDLLRKYGCEISVSKKGAFCRLAALLSGEPRADRTFICKQVFARSPKR